METIWIKDIKAHRNCVTYHLDVSEGLVRYFSPSCEMFAVLYALNDALRAGLTKYL